MATTTGTTVPFNGVDSLMRGLDERHRPQTIELEVAVSGRLDDRRVRDAVALAVGRHPMARARQLPASPFDLNDAWEITDVLHADPVEVVAPGGDVEVSTVRDRFLSAHVDLGTAPPFRLLVVHEGAGDRVMLSVNHAAFDGVGSLRLLQSISRAYAGEDDPLPDVDPLGVRQLLDVDSADHQRRGVRSTRPSAGAPARLAAAPSGEASGFGVLHLDLDVAAAAPPPGATVNDVLMAALHLTVARWNASHGAPCGRVSIMMPVNRRPAAWRGEVLANLVLSAQVESTPADRARPERLVEVVAAQTQAIKSGGVGSSAALAKTSRTPVVLRRLLPHVIDAVAEHTADTAVLSNLGNVADPPWFGEGGRGLWFGPPPRRPVICTLGAASTGGRLGISLRWCRSALSASAAAELGGVFTDALGAVAGTRSSP